MADGEYSVSIILVSGDQPGALAASLDSLCLQTFPRERFEVVVVEYRQANSASSIGLEYSGRIGLHVVHQRDVRTSAAKNMGIKAASGDILIFLEEGALADPLMVAEHVKVYQDRPGQRVAVRGRMCWDPSLKVTELMGFVAETGPGLISGSTGTEPGRFPDCTWLRGGNWSCRRSLLERHGVFNEQLRFGFEDAELCNRLEADGILFLSDPSAKAYFPTAPTYDEFCRQCERLGRSHFELSRVCDMGAASKCCTPNGLVQRWEQLKNSVGTMSWQVAELEGFLEKVHQTQVSLDALEKEAGVPAGWIERTRAQINSVNVRRFGEDLRRLYQESLEAFRSKGFAEETRRHAEKVETLPGWEGHSRQHSPGPMGLTEMKSSQSAGRAPDFSMVVLTYNQLEYTKACIESIRRHTSRPFEIIFVDNASTDGTVEYLRRLSSSLPRVNVVQNRTNRGFSGGNNQGLTLAKGRYVLLLNNDIVVTPGWVDDMAAFLDQYPETGLVGPMSNSVPPPQLVSDVGYDNLSELDCFAAQRRALHKGQSMRIPCLMGFCLLIRREVVNVIGGLDEIFRTGNFEDVDYCIRAGLAGFDLRMALGVYIHHEGNKSFENPAHYQRNLKSNWELLKAKWELPKNIPYGAGFYVDPATTARVPLRVDLPDLGTTHTPGLDGRWWSERADY